MNKLAITFGVLSLVTFSACDSDDMESETMNDTSSGTDGEGTGGEDTGSDGTGGEDSGSDGTGGEEAGGEEVGGEDAGSGGDSGSDGEIVLDIWGEQYIESGIPAFSDGYSVTFTKFLVNLTSATIHGAEAGTGLEHTEASVWDLVVAGPHTVTTTKAAAGDYNKATYTISPASSGSVAGNVSDEDLKMMSDGGLTYYLVGSATNGTTTKTFTWGLTSTWTYECARSAGTLEVGGTNTAELTIHGDDMFMAIENDWATGFQEYADADANDDGEVTAEELEAVSVDSEYYKNLWQRINHLSEYIGHIDGEGHCDE